ncbi:CDP-glycerol glycerophosphotransferase family protein [Blautia sp. Sow4_E7]|uniref:CDP-glycerol glycerophosphotransferase family protein n=1 Tax=Blautia sp. Sow4_E7 TaxID=3438749 RepID=UPI003F8F3E1D
MSEIEKILEQNMEEYESARRRANKLVNGYRREISKTYEYADALVKLPVNPDQIFFLWEKGTGDGELIREMYEYVKKTYGKKYICICCVKGSLPFGNAGKVTENSAGYWRALASSGIIVSSVELPASFVKREGQIYLNTMSKVYEKKRLDTKKFVSETVRDMLKTDFIFAPDRQQGEETWTKKCLAGRVYPGKVLALEESVKDKAAVFARFLLEKTISEGLECFSLRNPEKKRLLILGSGAGKPEVKLVVDRILARIDPEKYDVAFFSEDLGSEAKCKAFFAQTGKAAGLMGVGKMTVSEAEYLNYLTVEKNPEAYLGNPILRSYIDELARREWNRLFGTASWDGVIVAGSAKYLPYYLAAKARTKMKVLVDLDFLPYIHEKYPARWRKALTVFNRIYAPADCQQLGSYGQENRLRVMRLPVLVAEQPEEGQVEVVSYQEKEYLVCDKKKAENGHISMKLVRKPEQGSVLVNADLLPNAEQKKRLEQLDKGHKIYVLGEQSSAYKNFLPSAVVLDEYVRKQLYLLPEAWEFFSGFEGYVGNAALEEDVTEKICRAFGVKKCLTE